MKVSCFLLMIALLTVPACSTVRAREAPAPTPTSRPAESTLVPTPLATVVPARGDLVPPVSSAAARTPAWEAANTVPILMYHHVRVNPDPTDKIGANLSVTPEDFEDQMAFLADHGYRSVSLRDLDSLEPGQPGAVIITFDDGYADVYESAWPVLLRHGFKATIYAVTDLVGVRGHVTWKQLREMAASGMTVGSHSVDHSDLTALNGHQLRFQLIESRSTLELALNRPVLDFCYPSGAYNSIVEAGVRQAGYKTAVTVVPGIYTPGGDHLALPRVRVAGWMKLANFAAAIGYDQARVDYVEQGRANKSVSSPAK